MEETLGIIYSRAIYSKCLEKLKIAVYQVE